MTGSSNQPSISVVICTHNPRADFLQRTLDALKQQTFPSGQWELLLIDNASAKPVASSFDITWHPLGRHVCENELGLTPARLRGIKESRGDVLVFVDDDNLLAKDFLAQVMEIAMEYPFLGAWGGHVEGEFEETPPPWLKAHHNLLALRNVDRDYWSNYYSDIRSVPVGAGLCVRKSVVTAYANTLAVRPEFRNLDRKGSSLMSGGDIDLALTAHDNGLATGMFKRLHITHIIPKSRMTVEYVCRLLEAVEFSTHLLMSRRDFGYSVPSEPSAIRYFKACQVWRLPEPLRSFAKAQQRGLETARASILNSKV